MNPLLRTGVAALLPLIALILLVPSAIAQDPQPSQNDPKKPNTIVIFASDNGPTSNKYAKPYRGTKYVTFEGGHRVPFVFHWPAKVAHGSLSNVNINAMDLFPTLSEIVGASLPTDRIYDGVSLLPLLDDQPLQRAAETPFYYFNCENLQAVRRGDWKLHLPRTKEQLPFWEREKGFGELKEPMLYNLKSDQAETTNVAAEYPEVCLLYTSPSPRDS